MMRRHLKVILYLLLSTLIMVAGFFMYMENSISNYVSGERFEEIVRQFNETEELPEHFYTVIEKYKSRILSRSPWIAYFNVKLMQNGKTCSCGEVYVHPGFVDSYSSLAPYVVQLELYDRVGAKKCYDYLFAEFVGSTHFRNAGELSMNLFSKNLDALTEKEILTLDLFVQSPIYYRQLKRDPASIETIVEKRMEPD